jgi:hypothetical protein
LIAFDKWWTPEVPEEAGPKWKRKMTQRRDV